MKSRNNQYLSVIAQSYAVAILAATLAFAPTVAFAADRDVHEERVELRIKDIHSKLNITSAQEEQWDKVVGTMREDAKIMDKLTQARFEHAKDMTAIDELKSYGEITDAHAEGIKKLTSVFTDLYASMSIKQKKEADTLFRYGYLKQGDHKQGHSKSKT